MMTMSVAREVVEGVEAVAEEGALATGAVAAEEGGLVEEGVQVLAGAEVTVELGYLRYLPWSDIGTHIRYSFFLC